MSRRLAIWLLILFVAAPLSGAKNKKKQLLPDYVLNAQTVLVVIEPEAGEPLTNPTANRTAQENVERELEKWGRFRLVMGSPTADLIVAVRTGHAGGPTISNSPVDDRPVIVQPSDGGIRVGGHQGRPPDLNNPGLGTPDDGSPRIGNQIGPSEDMFAVYRGGIDYPLDAPPIWRYMAKGALSGPQAIPAVEQFKKALTESEKQRAQRP
jgi:hypothetical protein